MKKLASIIVLLGITITLLSCSSDGTKAANELIDCMEKSLNSNDYSQVQSKIKDCQERFREKYKDKAQDPKFQEDFDKTFNEKYKEFESKLKEKFKD